MTVLGKARVAMSSLGVKGHCMGPCMPGLHAKTCGIVHLGSDPHGKARELWRERTVVYNYLIKGVMRHKPSGLVVYNFLIRC